MGGSDGSWQGGGCLEYFVALCNCTSMVFLGDIRIATHTRACPKLCITYHWNLCCRSSVMFVLHGCCIHLNQLPCRELTLGQY